MVIGENQKFPSAFIVPNFAYVKEWIKREKIDCSDISNSSICKNEKVIARINEDVTEFNKEYGNWEQIKKIALLDKELTVEGGELTPTLKLKRKIILEKYKANFDHIYCD